MHLGRSEKAESQEADLDLRQQKHQEPEIENSEGDEKSLTLHDLPPLVLRLIDLIREHDGRQGPVFGHLNLSDSRSLTTEFV